PWVNAHAWSLRLSRAVDYEPREVFDRIMREFLAQPETLVWYVVTDQSLGERGKRIFPPAEARRILFGLSEEIRRRIADRTIELPPDVRRWLELDPEGLTRIDVDARFARYDELMGVTPPQTRNDPP